jgi:hypothetical protein
MPSDVVTFNLADQAPLPPRSMRRRRRELVGGHAPRRVVAVAVALALVAGIALWATLSGSPTRAKTPPVAPSYAAGTKAVLGATRTVTAAGTTMSVALAGLHTLPTVASVSAIVTPYGTALGRYHAALAAARVSPAATTWRTAVVSQLDRLSALIATLASTPSATLGQWINGFYLQTAELQSAIEELQAALGHPASS